MLVASRARPTGAFPLASSNGWHLPATQAPPRQEWPHAPQLSASVARTVSQPSSSAVPQWAKPGEQVSWHLPPAHAGAAAVFAAPQTWLHAPQLATFELVETSQPFFGSASQSAKPVEHEVAHAPSLQMASAF